MKKLLKSLLVLMVIIIFIFFGLTKNLENGRYYKVRSINVYVEELDEEKNVSLWRTIYAHIPLVGWHQVLIISKYDDYCIMETARNDEYLMMYNGNVYHPFDLLLDGIIKLDDLKELKYPMKIDDKEECGWK